MNFILYVGVFIPILTALPLSENSTAVSVDDKVPQYKSCMYHHSSTLVNGVSQKNESKILDLNGNCEQYNKMTSNSASNLTEYVVTCTHQKCGDNVVETIPCDQFDKFEC